MKKTYVSACYCTNLRRGANALSELYDRAMEGTGLTVSQYYLLINLSRLGSANTTRWAERVGLDRSTMVRNVRVLEGHGFIAETVGRGRTFSLTPEGEAALSKAQPAWQRAQEVTENLLGSEDRDALLRCCQKLQAAAMEGEAASSALHDA